MHIQSQVVDPRSMHRGKATSYADLVAQGWTPCGCTYAPPEGAYTCGRCNHGTHWHRVDDPQGTLRVYAGPDGAGKPVYRSARALPCEKLLKPPALEWEEKRPANAVHVVTAPACSACTLPLSENGPHVEHAGGLADAACVKALQEAQESSAQKTAGVLAKCSYCGAQALRGQLAPSPRGLAHPKCRRALE